MKSNFIRGFSNFTLLILFTIILIFIISPAISLSDDIRRGSTGEPIGLIKPSENLGDIGSSLYEAGEVIVIFKEGVSTERINEIIAGEGGDIKRVNGKDEIISKLNAYRIKMPPDTNIENAITAFNAYSEVLVAEPNYIRELLYTPNDLYLNRQWGLSRINAYDGWDISMGTAVLVGVVDTGVDVDHIELANNIALNIADDLDYGDTDDDDDNNGYEDDYYGWNFVYEYPLDPDFNGEMFDDRNGHGTHVSGIIAAVADNSTGIAGVNPNANIIPAGSFSELGFGNDFDISDGIIYVVERGAQVINMSFGGSMYSSLLHEAINYALENDVVPVASSGNTGGEGTNYPASLPGVMSVGSSAYTGDTLIKSDIVSDFSTYGLTLDVVAPGENILSTFYHTYDFLLPDEGSMLDYHTADQINPDISGSWVVWEDYRNGLNNADIYAFDLHSSIFGALPITTQNDMQINPAIYDDYIVWEDYRSTLIVDFNSVYFSSGNDGVVVGDNGTIIRTLNAGVEWESANSGTIEDLYEIFIDIESTESAYGYIVGTNGTILKTSNSGENWSSQVSGTGNDLNSVYAYGNTKGFAVGDGGVILITTNGGVTWNSTTPVGQDLNSVFVPEETSTHIVGDSGRYINSRDEGISWNASIISANDLYSVYFISDDLGFAVGENGTVLRTENAGVSWASKSITGNDLYSVFFLDADNGFTVGENGEAYRTLDSGVNWETLNTGVLNDLNSNYFTSSSNGFAVGDNGTIIKTNDSGDTWNEIIEEADIYMYQIGVGETPITADVADQKNPDISYSPSLGNYIVVFEGYVDDPDNADIYMYNIGTAVTTRVTNNPGSQINPSISGDYIVWEDYRNGVDNPDIYLYDISTLTETPLITNGWDQTNPKIDGNIVVWEDNRNIPFATDNWDIYMYDISGATEKQITANTEMQILPNVSGNRIAWSDYREGSKPSIFLYDLGLENAGVETPLIQVSSGALYGGDQFRVVIDGDYLVWYDGRNNSQGDIFVAQFNRYRNWSGTSMASPHVAGLVSLMLSVDPTLERGEIENIIEQTAYTFDAVGDFWIPIYWVEGLGYATFGWPWDALYGYGLIDVDAALFAAANPGTINYYDDQDEPNDTVSQADNLGTLKTQETASSYMGNNSDTDFYSFNLETGGEIKITLTDVPPYCDYDLFLYSYNTDGSWNDIMSSSISEMNDDDEITAELERNQRYYVEVRVLYGFNDDMPNPFRNRQYTLTIEHMDPVYDPDPPGERTSDQGTPVERLAGSDRYLTAIEISK
ncbi:MAG: S8 family serine peptidase, partial [Actinomycetia bacterium]|nr:S8 family serine peptidase [Actinomycetes bacterium]